MASPSIYHPEISMGMSRGTNVGEYQFDRNMSRNPENIVTIFTVNTREQYSASGQKKFPGRESGERYRKVGMITDPTHYHDNLSVDGQKDQHKVIADDGQWAAMDWLNPENVFTLNQDFVVPNRVDDSTDLLARGLFFIVRPYYRDGNLHDKPTDEEAAAAEKRLRTRYLELRRKYQITSQSNPGNLPRILNPEMIDALNMAPKIKTPYNTDEGEVRECETCGENIPAGAKFHRSASLGVICINPSTEGWKAAVNAGIKTRDEVPEEFRWAGRSPNPR